MVESLVNSSIIISRIFALPELGIGLIAAFLNVLGFVLYFRAMRKSSSTSSVAWFLSTVIAASAAVSQFTVSGFASSANYIFGAICCASVFIMSIKKKAVVSDVKKKTVFVAILVAILSILAPNWSIYCLCLYYIISYSLFLQAIIAGSNEPVIPWLVWCSGAIMQITAIAMTNANVQAYVLPITNLICWSAVFYMALRKYRDYN